MTIYYELKNGKKDKITNVILIGYKLTKIIVRGASFEKHFYFTDMNNYVIYDYNLNE